MNQILATKPVKQRKNVEITTVMRFFAISLIIFGLCLVTSGSYAVYISMSTQQNNTTTTNNNNNNNVNIPKSSEIQINLTVDGSNILATVIGENKISFVTYKWDDEEETRIDIDSYSDDVTIEIPSGDHILTVTAVDEYNNSEIKKQQVKGIVRGTSEAKPKIEVERGNEQNTIIVKVSDEVGLKEVKIILNGQEGTMSLDGKKEMEINCPLKEGENTLEVTAYNSDGASEVLKNTIPNQ